MEGEDGTQIEVHDELPGALAPGWYRLHTRDGQQSYVHYDADTMLAVLSLEAHRAHATVVGEDLGTVEPEVTEALAGNGMLGCAVAWFTRDQTAPDLGLLDDGR